MSLGQAKRKIKRVGKTAVQFRITSTFEFIELECKGTWRPENLRVIWLRNHRKVKSNDTTWIVSEDFGPNGAKGKAIFNPALSVSLVVTLYRDSNNTEFEEKEYKYYVESEGPGGKKILAAFNCNVADFVGIPSTKQALDLNFKCVSKKVSSVRLGITLESMFMKAGGAQDDDMQSTFSAMSAGVESVVFDDDDDEEGVDVVPSSTSDGTWALDGSRPRLNTLKEESENEDSSQRSVILGTGEHLKRDTIPRDPPSKPPRKFLSSQELLDSQSAEADHLNDLSSSLSPTQPNQVDSSVSPTQPNQVDSSVSPTQPNQVDSSVSPTQPNQVDSSISPTLPHQVDSSVSPTQPNQVDSSVSPTQPNQVDSSISPSHPRQVDSSISPSHPRQVDVAVDEKGVAQPKGSGKLGHNGQGSIAGEANLEHNTDREIEDAMELGGVVHEESLKMETAKEVESPGTDYEQESASLEQPLHHGDEGANGKGVTSASPAGEETRAEESETAVTSVSTAPAAEQAERKEETKKEVTSKTEKLENFKTSEPEKSQEDEVEKSGIDEQVMDQSKSETANTEEEVSSRNMEPTLNQVQEGEADSSSLIKGPPFVSEEVKLEPAQDGMNGSKDDPNVGRLSGLEPAIDSTVPTAAAATDKSTSSSTSGRRQTIESNETYAPPPNPYLEDKEEDEEVENPRKLSPIEVWIDSNVVLVDCFEEVVGPDKLNEVDLIGLYFSAGWCPPCRRFLPKLVKFYHHLKQHGKHFELVYISSDYSKQDMVKYMKEQQMPWVGVEYGGEASEMLRKKFQVTAVPMLKILGTRGYVVEDSAKKSIEAASSGSAILKLYNKWHDNLEEERTSATSPSDSKKGLFGKVKATISIQGKEKSKEQDSVASLGTVGSPSASSGRLSLDTHTRTKGKGAKGGVVTQELLDEKEERIQHLEEVNRTLKQTNDDHVEEVEELRQKMALLTSELNQIKSTSKTLQDESKELIANLSMRGWLYKRGVKGPTASIWRRRYFRLDEGSKLYYYKNSTEGNPQGHIDIDKVLSVQEVASAQQDKNHATFTVQCDGRTFQLQAHDEASMRRWMEAILYITNWRKKTLTKNSGAHP